jgi:hypothetical protein
MPEYGKSLKAGQTITLAGPFLYADASSVRVDMSFPIKKEVASKTRAGSVSDGYPS